MKKTIAPLLAQISLYVNGLVCLGLLVFSAYYAGIQLMNGAYHRGHTILSVTLLFYAVVTGFVVWVKYKAVMKHKRGLGEK